MVQLYRPRTGAAAEANFHGRFKQQKKGGNKKLLTSLGLLLFSFLMLAILVMSVVVTNLRSAAALEEQQNKSAGASTAGSPGLRKAPTASSKAVQATNQKRGIWVRPEFLAHLQELGPIPRKVHIFWPKKTLLEHMELNMVKHGIGHLKELNPTWEFKVYDDADIDQLIQQSTDLLPPEELKMLKTAHVVEQSDVARLIILYREGGLYTDVDRWFNKELDPILRNDKLGTHLPAMCLPSYMDINFMQSLLCSAPGNNVWKWHLERSTQVRLTGGYTGDKGIKALERLPNGWLKRNDLFKIGPPVYNDIIFTHVLEGPLAQVETKRKWHIPKPPKTTMSKAREAIEHGLGEEHSGLIVTSLDMGCNGLLSAFEGRCPNIDKQGAQRFFGMKQWGKEVQEHWDKKTDVKKP